MPRTSLGILLSEAKLTHYRDSPGRPQSCKCIYPVNQHTLFNYSCFKLSGEKKNTTPEQIPIVSFTFTWPASRSFPTGSNILLAMFNSYFTWGIESTKWFQLFRHYISVCPLLLPLSSSHTPSGTFLPLRVKGQLFSKPKRVSSPQKRKLLRCWEKHTHTLHKYHSTCALARPPSLQHNHSSFTRSTAFPTLQNTFKEGCMCLWSLWLGEFTFGHEMDTVCMVLPQAFCSNCIVS